jgi:hypothetical protein
MTKEKKVKKAKEAKKQTPEFICPSCGKPVETHKCRLCGATRTVSQVSGNIIWMKNGRVVAAFDDEKQAYMRMAKQYGIPEKDWPERFKDGR